MILKQLVRGLTGENETLETITLESRDCPVCGPSSEAISLSPKNLSNTPRSDEIKYSISKSL